MRAGEACLVDLIGPQVLEPQVDLRVARRKGFIVGRQAVQPDAVDGGHAQAARDDGRAGPRAALLERGEALEQRLALASRAVVRPRWACADARRALDQRRP